MNSSIVAYSDPKIGLCQVEGAAFPSRPSGVQSTAHVSYRFHNTSWSLDVWHYGPFTTPLGGSKYWSSNLCCRSDIVFPMRPNLHRWFLRKVCRECNWSSGFCENNGRIQLSLVRSGFIWETWDCMGQRSSCRDCNGPMLSGSHDHVEMGRDNAEKMHQVIIPNISSRLLRTQLYEP